MKRLLYLLIIALLLVGCASEPGEETPFNNAAEVVPVRADRELTVASYRADTLCPLFTKVNANAQMLGLVFDSLIVCENDMTPSPLLARSWSASEDGLEWHVELNDAKWHDGSYFSADDVIFTINTIKQYPDSLYYKNAANILRVTGSDLSVDIRLRTPQPNFMNLMYFPIIRQQSGKIDRENYNPVGTGSFKFDTEAAEEGGYVLVRNVDCFRGAPYLERIVIKLLPDKDTNVFAFASNDVDIAGVTDSDWASRVNTAEVNSCVFPTGRYNFLGFNFGNTFLKDVKVRRAIKRAVDNKRIVDTVLYGQGIPADTPVNREWFMYSPGVEFEYDSDLELDITLELLLNEDNAIRELVANQIIEDLAEIGIRVNIKKVDNNEYLRLLNNRRFDMVLAEVDILSDVDLGFLLGRGNAWGYASADMEAALKATLDSFGMKAAYATVQQLYEEDAVGVGLYFKSDVLLYSRHVEGELRPVFHNIYRGLENN